MNSASITELSGDDKDNEKCKTFVFQNEGHTLGNALSSIITRYPDVEFCGYTVPHPAETKMHFRIQSRIESAVTILKRGLEDLEKVCDHTLILFESRVDEFEKVQNLNVSS